MALVLNILPHPGGGAERIVDMLEASGGGFEHRRAYLAHGRTPLGAAPRLVAGRPALARGVRRADLVHVIGDASACLTAGLLGLRPSVFGTHGLHLLRRARGPLGPLVRRSLRAAVARANVTVCTSEPELEELRALVPPAMAPRLRLVLNGIRLPEAVGLEERRAAREALGLEDGTFAVLYLGELELRKDPLTAARAVARLERPAVLLVAGEGPLRPELEGMPCVRALGFRDDAEELLAAADVFVMPSEREGLSLAVLEAMGRGVPTVVSDGAGNPQAVGDAGVVFPLGDDAALAAELDRLAAGAAERARLADAGRRRVASVFSLDRWEVEMRGVLEDVLAGKGATAPGPAAGEARA